MIKYNKKNITREEIYDLHKKFGIDLLESSIFARRGINTGKDIMYYLESDPRFIHTPFLFSSMEDAVSRINDAIDENEKVLIFGDRDVDGITSTAILYSYLKQQGLDVQWRLPVGEDSYGLSMQAVDDFAKEFGSLIITVDCGISNNLEIQHAKELGIDVIVTDHHNPPEELPPAIIIIDPKMSDSGYPFKDISGAAVAYKLVSALRFSHFQLYAQDFCLLDVSKTEEGFSVTCMKTRNLVEKSRLQVNFDQYPISISTTKLMDYLKGQQILVWNYEKTKSLLRQLFGSGVEFQMLDMQSQIAKTIPQIQGKELSELKKLSKIAFYSDRETQDIDGFFNIFVTYASKKAWEVFPQYETDCANDLQLVAIAALADIMPMQNENRIFVKNGLMAINSGKSRKGIAELLARTELAGKQVTSTDLSWKIIPVLNAAGRMGQSNLSLELLISEDPSTRNLLAQQIMELNDKRKEFVSDGEFCTAKQAEESFAYFNKKFCIVYDQKINRGITGILAAHLVKKFNVPSMAITFTEDGSVAVGSMRSCRGVVATSFLDNFGDFFINHGGHDAAAGFSFGKDKLRQFLSIASDLVEKLSLESEEEAVEVDAELPPEYITPDLLKLSEKFEPFGEKNPELVFVSKALPVVDAQKVGKTEKTHLKITFDCGKYKFPSIAWGEGDRLGKDFDKNDRLNIIYTVGKNTFNGNTTAQLVIKHWEKNL